MRLDPSTPKVIREGRKREGVKKGGRDEGRVYTREGRMGERREGKREIKEERKGGEEGDGVRRKGKKEGDVKKILLFPNNNKF